MKKLSQYANEQHIGYRAAWNRYKQGKIPNAWQDENGRIWVPDQTENLANKAIIYARVSTPAQRDDLDRQAERLREFAITRGYEVVNVVKEIGSGVNENRPKLQQVIAQHDEYGVLIIEHRDRLARVGYGYLNTMFTTLGKQILVTDQEENEDGRAEDILSVLYCFATSEYGKRGAKYRAQRAQAALESEPNA